jgi:hypothetical protein
MSRYAGRGPHRLLAIGATWLLALAMMACEDTPTGASSPDEQLSAVTTVWEGTLQETSCAVISDDCLPCCSHRAKLGPPPPLDFKLTLSVRGTQVTGEYEGVASADGNPLAGTVEGVLNGGALHLTGSLRWDSLTFPGQYGLVDLESLDVTLDGQGTSGTGTLVFVDRRRDETPIIRRGANITSFHQTS